MKKILLVAAVLFSISMGAMAQSAKSALQFVDDKGKVIPDGSVFEVTELVTQEGFEEGSIEYLLKPNLSVKNLKGKNTVGLKLDLKNMPFGKFGCCFGTCSMPFETPDIYMSLVKDMKENDVEGLESEWILEKADAPVTWEATITAGFCKQVETSPGVPETKMTDEGPSVKVKFIYTPTGIASVKDGNATVTEVERYNVQGQKISKPCKGINIIKLSNGKTVKKLIP
ncbi:hypothetical protein [Prevotella pallens]|jgi:hypothetical protein